MQPPRRRSPGVRTGPVDLRLDHVSIAVPDLSVALEELEQRLGLAAVRTAADPHHHSRIFLERAYIEVSDREPGPDWRIPYFFLRFGDPVALREHLEKSGLAWTWGSYQGVDGRWDDVLVESVDIPCPILVRRTEPADVARDWPPALVRQHSCDATSLQEVRVGVEALDTALDIYSRLLGRDPEPAQVGEEGEGARFPLADGTIVLVECDVPGVQAVVLGVRSLERACDCLGSLVMPGSDQTIWVDRSAAHGLQWAFTETQVLR
jgi:hypothetical protein